MAYEVADSTHFGRLVDVAVDTLDNHGRDDDGDVMVLGSDCLAYVRTIGLHYVEVFSFLVRGITDLDAAAAEVRELNASPWPIKFLLVDNCIVARLLVEASPFVPWQLRTDVEDFLAMLSPRAADLATRVGGRCHGQAAGAWGAAAGAEHSADDESSDIDSADEDLTDEDWTGEDSTGDGTDHCVEHRIFLELTADGAIRLPAHVVAAIVAEDQVLVMDSLELCRDLGLPDAVDNLREAPSFLARREGERPLLPPRPRREAPVIAPEERRAS